MSTICCVLETNAALPSPLEAAIAWFRNVRTAGLYLRELRVHADYMDDEEFLDAWARVQESAFLSVLYSVKRRHGYGSAAAANKKVSDMRISVLRVACMGTSRTGLRIWVIGDNQCDSTRTVHLIPSRQVCAQALDKDR
jgi:hypothetical protein